MPSQSQSIVEQAIADAARAEYERLTKGLQPPGKEQLVSSALAELQKLRNDRELPDYDNPAVALFYTLWYLPSQVNLACSLIEEVMPFNNDIHIIDFAAGPGALQLGVALAIARCRPAKPQRTVAVHEIDCAAMRNLSKMIWQQFQRIADRDGDADSQRAARTVRKFTYGDVNEAISAPEVRAPRNATQALTALHVIYENNRDEVKAKLSQLSEHAHPAWTFVTAPCVGSKLEITQAIVPFQATPEPVTKQPLTGQCLQLTNLRQKIRRELPYNWSEGKLLWSEVKWDFTENRSPYVLRHQSETERTP